MSRSLRIAAPYAAGGALAVLLSASTNAQLLALKAAGITGIQPQGGGAIASLVGTLQSNWEWLIVTGIGLALAIVFGLVVFGSQRAPEHVFRIAGGIVGLIVIIPAVLK